MKQVLRRCVSFLLIVLIVAPIAAQERRTSRWHFPEPGEGLEKQERRTPQQVGLEPAVISELRGRATRWALWRHGYLIHVEGSWNQTQDVASLRKTWHALAVGAAIGQGKIPSYRQKLRVWDEDLRGNDSEATWWHVITQSTGFDFPHPDYPHAGDPEPGKFWTYSDKNAFRLCNALARVYGRKDYRDNYDQVIRTAYFDAIGMRGWSTKAIQDGIRFVIDLEDMGRLGLLVLARGEWAGRQLIPRWFVEELESKQTRGMKPIYNGPDDGNVGEGWWHEHREQFRECPYGYMTWVNTDGDIYPGADKGWAYGAGVGGSRILWNYRFGIVFAAIGVTERATKQGIPHIIERNIGRPNPLLSRDAK